MLAPERLRVLQCIAAIESVNSSVRVAVSKLSNQENGKVQSVVISITCHRTGADEFTVAFLSIRCIGVRAQIARAIDAKRI